MKKIISLFVTMILMLSVCITANAAGTSTLNGNNSATVGSNIEFTVNVNGCSDATSIAVAVSYSDDFELVSGEWLKSGSITKFDTATNKGALGGLSSPNVNGNLFKLVLKAKTASANAQNVSVNVIAKNGSTEIMNVTPSKSFKIDCASHTYGAYIKVNDSQHKRTCTVCGHTETASHTWNGGTVTKQATCKEDGNKKYTCTACNAERNETIAKTTSHTFGAWSQVKAATCTEKGRESRSCSTCGKVETRNIEALGHNFSKPTVTKQPTCTETGIESGKCTRCGNETTNTLKVVGHKFGAWAEYKAATCTEGGTQKRVCSKCKTEETRNTDALGHDFDNPTVVKEATISSTGLLEGKCKRCGEATQEVIPCTAKDDLTGISFETGEGVFSEGTQITTEEIKSDNANYGSVKNLLSEITGKFSAYNISASLNGTEVQPNGEVKVTFNIPDGFGNDVVLYAISEDGKSEQIEAAVSEDGKTISATISNFGTYAVCKLGSDNSEDSSDVIDNIDSNNEEKSQNNKIWIIIAVIAVVLIAGAVTTLILVKKKKSDNPDDLGMFL